MIKIICLGKIKEKYLTDAIEEYKKRISKYTKIEIYELEDIDNKNIEVTLKKEEEEIMKYISKKDYIISLAIEGEELDSVSFANKIDNIYNSYSNITFIIGSSYGLSNDIKKMANYKMSFSKLTFPHQLFRVLLLEQIYRAYKINNNEEYHK